MSSKKARSDDAAELRRRAEAAVCEATAHVPDNSEVSPPEETRRTLHELRVYQIELETQNEELRRAQEELDRSQARYFDLYDLAPVGYCTVSELGLIQQANLAAATLLGVARAALVRQPISRFILRGDEDIFYLMRTRLIKTGDPQSCELRLVKHDGTPCWVQLAATAAQDEDGAPALRIVLSDITERMQAHDALQSLLREKDALLREVHHRVKNNLQVITSLLRLESRRAAQPDTRSVLEDLQSRVQSMALLHELLYRSGTFAALDLSIYLEQLIGRSFRTLLIRPGSVQLHLDLASVHVEMDRAMPCGLLVTELVSNCLKHGFPDGRTGDVRVELQPVDGASLWRLRVSDTGVGLPTDFVAKRGHTLGLQLVSELAEQVGGHLEVGPGPAAVFTVTFPDHDPRSSASSA